MLGGGRKPVVVVLSDEERETLERWARRHTIGQALALRCRIVLGAAARDDAKVEEGVGQDPRRNASRGATRWSTRRMAEAVGISASSVSKIWRAFGSSRTGPRISRSLLIPCS